MEPIKNFSIFKVKDHDGDPKKPTHSISTKIDDKYEYIGKCWTKDGASGKFLSCSLDKPYQQKPGYCIEREPSENDVKAHTQRPKTVGATPLEYPEEDINAEDVPF